MTTGRPSTTTDETGHALSAAREREAGLREILRVISSSRDDEKPVLEAIAAMAQRLCEAHNAVVWQLRGDRFELGASTSTDAELNRFRAEHPVPMSRRSATGRAIETSTIVHVADLLADPDTRELPIVKRTGSRTLLAVPLVSLSRGSVGVIALTRLVVDPFAPEQIALVEAFAAQAVIAIENVRQFRELQSRLEREAATREILQVISRSRDDETPVFDAILAAASRLCKAPLAFLPMANEARTHVTVPAFLGVRPDFADALKEFNEPMEGSDLVAVRAVAEARIIRSDDLINDPAFPASGRWRTELTETEGARSVLLVPLMQGAVAIGAIMLYRREIDQFDDDDVTLVETFAAQAVIAIENVRQFRELQDRLEREAATREILQVISGSRDDEQPVFDVILKYAARLCEAPSAGLHMVDEDREHYVTAARWGAPAGSVDMGVKRPLDSLLNAPRAIIENRVIHTDDLADTELYRQRDPIRSALVDRTGIRTYMAVPLTSGGQAIGCITLYRCEVRPFALADIALVEAFAEQAVIAIENVRQFRALQDRTEEVRAQAEELRTLNAELESRVERQVGELERMARLKRFLSPQVADAVMSSGDDSLLGSHRALIAILFCDMRGFTAFCESAEPEEAIEVLQQYHEAMGALVHEHGAGVDHRAGDGLMVIFNDPLPCDDPAGSALNLALAMRERMAALCVGWRRLGHRLGFGVGISLGYATVGMVGSEGRYDYTASGTAVNLAARLCDRAEDGEILLSPRAFAATEGRVAAEPAGELTLKGFSAPVDVFRVAAS